MDNASGILVFGEEKDEREKLRNWREKERERLKNEQQEQEKQKQIERVRAAILTEIERQQQLQNLTPKQAERFVVEQLAQHNDLMLDYRQRDAFIRDIVQDVTGLGPIQPLLEDPQITEIWGYAYDRIVIERNGKRERTDIRFRNEAHLRATLERVLNPLGKRLDESHTWVDARLSTGERLNVVIQPTAVDAVQFTIRKFIRDLDMQALLSEPQYISPQAAALLEALVRGRANLIISGGTSSGKTTLLNALSANFGETESIVVIEDPAELQLQNSWVRRFEASESVTVRTLVRNALRQNPDRIIIGEVRDGTAADMLQAMLTGHAGSISTIHADSAEIAVNERLWELVLEGRPQLSPQLALREIADAINIVIQLVNIDGTRQVEEIAEVVGFDDTKGKVMLKPLYQRHGSELLAIAPPSENLIDRCRRFGVELPVEAEAEEGDGT